MKKHRIFVSIDIPGKLKNVAEAHIEPFYKNKLARVAEKENWHITVVFCGYLSDEELKKLKETAKGATDNVKKFKLTPERIVFAPLRQGSGQAQRARMVWLIFKHSPGFLQLSKKFPQFSQGKREQFPHLTLVRFKEFHYPNLKKLLPENGIDLKDEAESFMVESINIMGSHLSPKGPRYELLEKINLSR